jgi:hypothetical protein
VLGRAEVGLMYVQNISEGATLSDSDEVSSLLSASPKGY